MKKAAGEGQVHLDAQLQAEWYKIQEEAKSKTSKLRTDHEALKATQASPSAARLAMPLRKAQGRAWCHLPQCSVKRWLPALQ